MSQSWLYSTVWTNFWSSDTEQKPKEKQQQQYKNMHVYYKVYLNFQTVLI